MPSSQHNGTYLIRVTDENGSSARWAGTCESVLVGTESRDRWDSEWVGPITAIGDISPWCSIRINGLRNGYTVTSDREEFIDQLYEELANLKRELREAKASAASADKLRGQLDAARAALGWPSDKDTDSEGCDE